MKTVVIGVGRPDHGDDAAGIEAARLIRARQSAALEVRCCTGDPVGLLEEWKGADRVVLVDAVVGSGGPAGSVFRFIPGASTGGGAHLRSSHGFGVGEALALARMLGRLPPQVVVFGIEAQSFEPGAALSPAVRAGVGEAASAVLEEIRSGAGAPRARDADGVERARHG